ncbi:DUF58 domain-containing protein [Parageobacillus thermoglucosidasius]|uniref:DUF58 domain-containing protein n=1 Tax=Parageobacillus thermoglucosidasius TaxID=1426 RepID=UPI003B67A86A
MRRRMRFIKQTFVLCGLFAALFSYAMFQGGFVSWFLFYSFLPFGLYSLAIIIYPFHRASVRRMIHQRRYHAGDSLTATVEVRFPVWFPFAAMTIEENDVSTLKVTQTKATIPFIWKKTFSYTYELRELPRGEHVFTAIRLTATDFFGLVEKDSVHLLEETIIVYPRYIDIAYRKVRYYAEQGIAASSLPLHRDMTMAVGVREYAPGDRFSLIHWKASARKLQLMTKEFEERQQDDDVVVVLDRTPTSLFEELVTFAASFVRAAIQHGVQTGFVSVGENRVVFPVRNRDFHLQQIFYHLATVVCDSQESFAHVISTEKVNWPSTVAFCYITSYLSKEMAQALSKLPDRVHKGTVFLIKEDLTKEERHSLEILRRKGVHVAVISPRNMTTLRKGGDG